MPKEKSSKRYMSEFKKMVMETMRKEKLCYRKKSNLSYHITELPKGSVSISQKG